LKGENPSLFFYLYFYLWLFIKGFFMGFESKAATLHWNQNNLFLVHGQSNLQITAEHVNQLRTQEDAEDFKTYFKTKALVNRSARRVFEAWEKKDALLLEKLRLEILS